MKYVEVNFKTFWYEINSKREWRRRCGFCNALRITDWPINHVRIAGTGDSVKCTLDSSQVRKILGAAALAALSSGTMPTHRLLIAHMAAGISLATLVERATAETDNGYAISTNDVLDAIVEKEGLFRAADPVPSSE